MLYLNIYYECNNYNHINFIIKYILKTNMLIYIYLLYIYISYNTYESFVSFYFYINSNTLYLPIRCMHEASTITHVVAHNNLFSTCPIFRAVGIFSNNTSTVSWATRVSAKSFLTGRFLRVLAVRQYVSKSGPVFTARKRRR